MPGLSLQQQHKIHAALQASRKIEAIKLYRTFTGTGLAEAKNAVERIEAEGFEWLGQPVEASDDGNSSFAEGRAQIVELLKAGRKIEAIKVYRELTHVDLKQAKDEVEAMESTLDLKKPSAGRSPFEPKSSSSGCGTRLLMLLLVTCSLVYLVHSVL
jgi:ribosomal protein L7/L12